MNPFAVLRQYLVSTERSRQTLEGTREGIATLAGVTDRHLKSIISTLEAAREDSLRARAEAARPADFPPPRDPGPEAAGSSDIEIETALATLRRHAADEKAAARIFDRVLDDVVMQNHRSMSWGDRLLTLDKSVAFRDDPVFKAAFGETTGETGVTQYASPDGIAWRLNTLVWAARRALRIPGDFVECGVYKGDMSWVIMRMVDLVAAGKEFYLYDTYEGFAAQYSSEADFPLAPQFFDQVAEGYKTSRMYEFVCDRFSGLPHAKIIKGVVPDILHQVSPDKIAFLHIDMNSAAAEIGALELLFDRVSPGGIIIFDDYGWILYRNQKEAEDVFARSRGYEILELPTGQGMLFKY